jgi:hypothetical protein
MSVCRRMVTKGMGSSPVGHPVMVPSPNTRSSVPATPAGTKSGPPSGLWLEFGTRQSGKLMWTTMPSSVGGVRPWLLAHAAQAEQEYGHGLCGLLSMSGGWAPPLAEQSQKTLRR